MRYAAGQKWFESLLESSSDSFFLFSVYLPARWGTPSPTFLLSPSRRILVWTQNEIGKNKMACFLVGKESKAGLVCEQKRTLLKKKKKKKQKKGICRYTALGSGPGFFSQSPVLGIPPRNPAQTFRRWVLNIRGTWSCRRQQSEHSG